MKRFGEVKRAESSGSSVAFRLLGVRAGVRALSFESLSMTSVGSKKYSTLALPVTLKI